MNDFKRAAQAWRPTAEALGRTTGYDWALESTGGGLIALASEYQGSVLLLSTNMGTLPYDPLDLNPDVDTTLVLGIYDLGGAWRAVEEPAPMVLEEWPAIADRLLGRLSAGESDYEG